MLLLFSLWPNTVFDFRQLFLSHVACLLKFIRETQNRCRWYANNISACYKQVSTVYTSLRCSWKCFCGTVKRYERLSISEASSIWQFLVCLTIAFSAETDPAHHDAFLISGILDIRKSGLHIRISGYLDSRISGSPDIRFFGYPKIRIGLLDIRKCGIRNSRFPDIQIWNRWENL